RRSAGSALAARSHGESQMLKRLLNWKTGSLFAGLMLLTGLAWAGDRLPPGSKPIVDVLKAVESAGYTAITEISFDDGAWEVEALRDGHSVEVTVSPLTVEVISARSDEAHRQLPANGKPLVEILQQLQA